MDKNTLGEFLLSRFPDGTLLPVPEITPTKPGTIGDMVPPLERIYAEATCFHLKEKVPLERMCDILSQYYTRIKWVHRFDLDSGGEIMGDVWPAEAEICVGVWGFYQRDTTGRETNILVITLNPGSL